MFSGIRNWLAKRKAAAQTDDFQRGYNYAAGQILGQTTSVEQLEYEADCGEWRNHFDYGMEAAIQDAKNRGLVPCDQKDTQLHLVR